RQQGFEISDQRVDILLAQRLFGLFLVARVQLVKPGGGGFVEVHLGRRQHGGRGRRGCRGSYRRRGRRRRNGFGRAGRYAGGGRGGRRGGWGGRRFRLNGHGHRGQRAGGFDSDAGRPGHAGGQFKVGHFVIRAGGLLHELRAHVNE